MQAEEFLKKVRVRAGLDNMDDARRATRAVFDTLRARISHAGGDNVAAQLPRELQQLWEAGLLEHILRSISGVERMDMGAFLARVAKEADLTDIHESETVTRAVFMTLQEQITPGAAHAIEHQLPPDILEFWNECKSAAREAAPVESEPIQEAPQIEPQISIGSPTPEEEEGALTWSPETDVPTGIDAEMLEAESEARYREMRARPPAEERIEMVEPEEARSPDLGPGSEAYYRGDADLAQEIVDMLQSSDEVDATNVDVMVQAGNVTLRGKVPTQEQKEKAHHIAASSLGVGVIRNELMVEEE